MRQNTGQKPTAQKPKVVNQPPRKPVVVERKKELSPIEEDEIQDGIEEIQLDQDFLKTMIIAQVIANPKGKYINKKR